MDPIFNYLNNGMLSMDKSVAHKVTCQAPHYILYDEKLYKRSFTLLLLKCLPPSETDYALKERFMKEYAAIILVDGPSPTKYSDMDIIGRLYIKML